VVKLLALQLAAAVPFLIALVPTVAVMAGVIRQEILLPSDQGLPLWWRVVESTWPWLVVVAATVLLASHIYSVVGRELLARHVGLLPPTPGSSALRRVLGAPAALLRRPGRAVAASVAVWAVGICGAVVAAALIALGWTIAQVAYLSPPTGATVLATVATWMAAAAGTAVLVGLLGAALVLLGATAAMRSALLTRAAVGGRGLA
jgi:hypothetical protein